MNKVINNLREKPIHVRRMIAFATSVFVTGIIGIVWFSNLIAVGLNTQSETAKKSDATPSPLAMLFDQFKSISRGAGNQLASVSSVFGFMQSSTTEAEIYAAKAKTAIVSDESSAIGVKRESGFSVKDSSGADSSSDTGSREGFDANDDSLDSSY